MAGLLALPMLGAKGMAALGSGLGGVGEGLTGLLGGELGKDAALSELNKIHLLEGTAGWGPGGMSTPTSPAWKFLQGINQGMKLSDMIASETSEGGQPMYAATPGQPEQQQWPQPPQLLGPLLQRGISGQQYTPTASVPLQELRRRRKQ